MRRLSGGRISLVLLLLLGSQAARADMQGDEAALKLAAELVDALGGAETWSAARWLYTEESSYHETVRENIRYRGWRNLTEPQGHNDMRSEAMDFRYGWNTRYGWTMRDGEVTRFTPERLALEVDFWPREIYVMYYRFAVGDATLKLASTGDRSFAVSDVATGAPLGTFKISLEGGPLVWSSGDGEEDVTYVYGPLADFDGIRLPAWGSQLDGSWRFNYVKAYLTYKAPGTILEPPADEGS